MQIIARLVIQSIEQVALALLHNWPYLLASIAIASVLKLYVDADKVGAFLMRNRRAGVLAATTAAVATPLCSCGTTAVVLAMMAGMMPWAPIVAFMVASPLTSPQELIYSAGLFGWRFATAFFLASIFLGLAGGTIAALLESRGWLAGQARFVRETTCGCAEATRPRPRVRLADVAREVTRSGRQLLTLFLGFAFIGYFLNGLIPASWVGAVFGRGNTFSVVLAATLGLPLYINTEASLPLIRALLDAGMSQGAALAFMTAGAGTSIGAIAGTLTIARWRVVGLVVSVLWIGAIVSGYAFNAMTGLF